MYSIYLFNKQEKLNNLGNNKNLYNTILKAIINTKLNTRITIKLS